MNINNAVPLFPISIVSSLCGTSIRMLREYAKQGIIKPRKINNRRTFTAGEVDSIKEINFYLAERKMNIPSLKEFYYRAACWEIKQCRQFNCPAYGNIRKQCWTVVTRHKKCGITVCSHCPIFGIKTSFKKEKKSPLLSSYAYLI